MGNDTCLWEFWMKSQFFYPEWTKKNGSLPYTRAQPPPYTTSCIWFLGFVIGAKKPLRRAGACVTVMKEKVYIRCGISEEEGSMVNHEIERQAWFFTYDLWN
jgi:hypothetical protein